MKSERVQLPPRLLRLFDKLVEENAILEKKAESLQKELGDLSKEAKMLKARVEELEGEKEKLESQLGELRKKEATSGMKARVLEYIEGHSGEITVYSCARKLGLSVGEVEEAILMLRSEGVLREV